MKNILDFLIAALPWIGIGIFIAVSVVKFDSRKEERPNGLKWKLFSWLPALCFLFAAITQFLSGNKSGGTTWLVFAIVSATTDRMRMRE